MRQLIWLLFVWQAATFGAEVFRLDIDNVIHPVTVETVSRAVDQAKSRGSAVLLVRLNTPGGLMDASREVVEKLLASPVPIVTYVAPGGARAASAGFFILLAGDVAAMAPGTRTGAASPVMLGKELDPVMRRKIESDSEAWLRSLAARRGRNGALAEKTVSEAKSFTEREALDGKLIDLIAKDEADLIHQLDGKEITRFDGTKRTLALAQPVFFTYEPTLREKFLKAISDPNLAFVLLILGALGLYVEFSTPGLILPGVAGGILALLGLSALSVLPINWLGAALILLAISLFILEAKFTSHGILGVGGAVAMVLGALMLVDGPPEFRISVSTAVALALPFAAITIFLTSLVIRAQRNKVTTGERGLVGESGLARTALDPEGKVFVHGEYWNATSSGPVPEGARVRVLAVDGLHLRVEPLP
jgi:membrane-bound serine protease (ClpP class)